MQRKRSGKIQQNFKQNINTKSATEIRNIHNVLVLTK